MSHTTTTLADVEAFIAANAWKFARTMPQSPHWYVHRERCTNDAAFVAVVQFIRDHGEARKFGRSRYVYLDIGAFTYWTMGAPLDDTILLNRAEISTARNPITQTSILPDEKRRRGTPPPRG